LSIWKVEASLTLKSILNYCRVIESSSISFDKASTNELLLFAGMKIDEPRAAVGAPDEASVIARRTVESKLPLRY